MLGPSQKCKIKTYRFEAEILHLFLKIKGSMQEYVFKHLKQQQSLAFTLNESVCATLYTIKEDQEEKSAIPMLFISSCFCIFSIHTSDWSYWQFVDEETLAFSVPIEIKGHCHSGLAFRTKLDLPASYSIED